MTDTITIPRATVQQALDALERTNSEPGSMAYEREAKASVALEDALRAAPQQQAEPVAAAPALIEALDHIAKTIERQIELIKDRAPGVYLDKRPVVKSLQSHAKRARDAIAKAIGTAT